MHSSGQLTLRIGLFVFLVALGAFISFAIACRLLGVPLTIERGVALQNLSPVNALLLFGGPPIMGCLCGLFGLLTFDSMSRTIAEYDRLEEAAQAEAEAKEYESQFRWEAARDRYQVAL